MRASLTTDDILTVLRRELSYLRARYGVERLAVYGSFARGEAQPGSDVDLLVELAQPSAFDFVNLADYLEDLLGRRVDLATFESLRETGRDPRHRHIAADVERTLVDVEAA